MSDRGMKERRVEGRGGERNGGKESGRQKISREEGEKLREYNIVEERKKGLKESY